MKDKIKPYASVLLLVVIGAVAWSSGLLGLWTDGMAYIVNNAEKFTDKTGHLIEGEYSMEVDLSDIESNLGKEIYNDGDHRIYVSWLQTTQNGGYDIGFRSSGKYALSGATLVSGAYHETINDHSFTTSTQAKMVVEYDGNLSNAQSSGQCGINYKDGDCFSFAFFLSDERTEGNSEEGVAKLTITDLYKNVWRKK
ncbi:hypothetical protein FE782_14290 [Paenibacillus antri]|uniref:Uncharacterized protein n=1 Tax=Paenibacillus antri TaxID=2582848 RepID=A0A5R9GBH7_9BACL|nr:hypothetical protein [Paenibacillus antri]TLS51666.1 hypothetical protein FE782_14290 [Paenibacillus antri]